MHSPHKALEAFADAGQNPDLLRLENLLARFNLFEAVGVVRHELRHSDFLAYLLNPGQHHGLGAVFLKELLKAVLLTTESSNVVSPADLRAWDLSRAAVHREWHHIDILIVDDLNRFAVLIENKIGTGEHSGQLNRYHSEFHRHLPGYKAVALYLTPDGDEPSSSDYYAVSYKTISEVIEKITQDNRTTLTSEVVLVLEHYVQILRRHIVSDSDVAELCRSIYQKHRQALDLIFEHRPDQQAQIRQYVESLIQEQPDVSFDPKYSGKNWIVFSLKEWQNSPRSGGASSDNISWILYFQFINKADNLRLDLMIAPGDELEREKHLRMAQKHQFRGYSSKLTGKFSRIASVSFLHDNDYEKPQDEIETIIFAKWADYVKDELPRIVKAVREEEWLWTL